MYATLKTYAPGCTTCSSCSRETYQLPDPSSNYVLVQDKPFIDSPELRRQRRGGMGIDEFKPGNVQKKSCCDIREGYNKPYYGTTLTVYPSHSDFTNVDLLGEGFMTRMYLYNELMAKLILVGDEILGKGNDD